MNTKRAWTITASFIHGMYVCQISSAVTKYMGGKKYTGEVNHLLKALPSDLTSSMRPPLLKIAGLYHSMPGWQPTLSKWP